MHRYLSVLILLLVFPLGSCTDTEPLGNKSTTEIDGYWVGTSTVMKSIFQPGGGVASRTVRIDEPVQLVFHGGSFAMVSEDELVLEGNYRLSPDHILITPTYEAYDDNPALVLDGEFEYSLRPQLDGIKILSLERFEYEFSSHPGKTDSTWRFVRLYPGFDEGEDTSVDQERWLKKEKAEPPLETPLS